MPRSSKMRRVEHKKYLAKIGAKGGAATALERSCRKQGKDHTFEAGVCTRCGASEAKYLAAKENGARGGRPRDKKPSAVALAQRKWRSEHPR